MYLEGLLKYCNFNFSQSEPNRAGLTSEVSYIFIINYRWSLRTDSGKSIRFVTGMHYFQAVVRHFEFASLLLSKQKLVKTPELGLEISQLSFVKSQPIVVKLYVWATIHVFINLFYFQLLTKFTSIYHGLLILMNSD